MILWNTNEIRMIMFFVQRLIYGWEKELVDKNDAKTQKLVRLLRQDLDPFFDMLNDKSMNKEVLGHIVTMISQWEAKDYRSANNSYMRLAIGNAAWPIGGVHLGVEQLKVRQVLPSAKHFMDDETQRKYLRSLKRVLTYVEERYPNE
eukprot:74890_1